MRQFILPFIFIFATASCMAHGFDITQSQEIGSYRVELGMTNANPVAGQRVGMSFSIDDKITTIPVTAKSASIRISKGDDIHFISSGFRMSNDTILSMSYVFPEGGVYEIDLKAGNVSATFPISVKSAGSVSYTALLTGICGLLLGIIITLLCRKRRKK